MAFLPIGFREMQFEKWRSENEVGEIPREFLEK
jgi:hypothetical protein